MREPASPEPLRSRPRPGSRHPVVPAFPLGLPPAGRGRDRSPSPPQSVRQPAAPVSASQPLDCEGPRDGERSCRRWPQGVGQFLVRRRHLGDVAAIAVAARASKSSKSVGTRRSPAAATSSTHGIPGDPVDPRRPEFHRRAESELIRVHPPTDAITGLEYLHLKPAGERGRCRQTGETCPTTTTRAPGDSRPDNLAAARSPGGRHRAQWLDSPWRCTPRRARPWNRSPHRPGLGARAGMCLPAMPSMTLVTTGRCPNA